MGRQRRRLRVIGERLAAEFYIDRTEGALDVNLMNVAARRRIGQMLIAPLLVIRRSLKLRRLVLYDLWDMTGFCYVIRAVRRAED